MKGALLSTRARIVACAEGSGAYRPRPLARSGLPDELVDDPGDVRARDRAHSQLPATSVWVLREPRPDAGLLEEAACDACATVSFASGPAHIDPESALIQGPDRQPVRPCGSGVRCHA
jgi:hypothetical protein